MDPIISRITHVCLVWHTQGMVQWGIESSVIAQTFNVSKFILKYINMAREYKILVCVVNYKLMYHERIKQQSKIYVSET